jgi:hypothetical protein
MEPAALAAGLRYSCASGSCGAAGDAQGSQVFIKRTEGYLSTGDFFQDCVQLLKGASHSNGVAPFVITLLSCALSRIGFSRRFNHDVP